MRIERQRCTETGFRFIMLLTCEREIAQSTMSGHTARIECNRMFQADFGAMQVASRDAGTAQGLVELGRLLLIDLRCCEEVRHRSVEIAKPA